MRLGSMFSECDALKKFYQRVIFLPMEVALLVLLIVAALYVCWWLDWLDLFSKYRKRKKRR
jgi:hypothetical protein